MEQKNRLSKKKEELKTKQTKFEKTEEKKTKVKIKENTPNGKKNLLLLQLQHFLWLQRVYIRLEI